MNIPGISQADIDAATYHIPTEQAKPGWPQYQGKPIEVFTKYTLKIKSQKLADAAGLQVGNTFTAQMTPARGWWVDHEIDYSKLPGVDEFGYGFEVGEDFELV